LVKDLMRDPAEALYRKGILFWDEIHLYMSPDYMRGAAGELLNGLVTQLGKRGLPLIYTTHLRTGVGPKLRNNTETSIRSQTNNHGVSALWTVRDEAARRMAADNDEPLPMDAWKVLRNAWRTWNWYDANEIISPFSMSESALATRRYKQIERALRYLEQTEDAHIEPDVRELNEVVAEAHANVLSELEDDDEAPMRRAGRKPTPGQRRPHRTVGLK
jgi:hypothetical protein